MDSAKNKVLLLSFSTRTFPFQCQKVVLFLKSSTKLSIMHLSIIYNHI